MYNSVRKCAIVSWLSFFVHPVYIRLCLHFEWPSSGRHHDRDTSFLSAAVVLQYERLNFPTIYVAFKKISAVLGLANFYRFSVAVSGMPS